MGVWRSRAVTRLDVQGGGARLLDAIEVDSSRGHCDARPVHPAGGSRPSRGSSSVPRAEAERTDLLRRSVTTLGQPVDGWQDEAQLQAVLLLSHTLSHRHTPTHAHTSHHQSDSYVALDQAPATLSLTAQHLSRPKEGNEAKRETSWATAHRTNRGGSSRDRYSSTPMACRLLCSALLVASAGAAFVGLTPSRRTAQRSAIVPLMAAEPIATTAGGSLEVSAKHYSLRSPLHHSHEIRTNARRCVSPRVTHAHHAPPLYSRAG